MERDLRLLRLENTPGGRVVSWLLLRGRTNGDGDEGGNERDKPDCQDLQKYLEEGRKCCFVQEKWRVI